MVWGYVEINAGLVCASVPALKPLFMRYLPFIIGSKIYSNDRSGATPGYGSRSNPLSSNKNRSKMAAQSYELHSQDNFPSRPNQEDDEAKLWGHTTISHKKEGPNKVKSGKNGSDDDSVDSIEGHYPGRIGRSTVVSGWGRNNSLSGGGINVTKETKVFYESS